MTINILFFSITVNKRTFTNEEIYQELEVQKISEEITDRKCSLLHQVY